MQIYNLKNKLEYLDEVAKLEYDEWADNKEENRKCRIERKKEKKFKNIFPGIFLFFLFFSIILF